MIMPRISEKWGEMRMILCARHTENENCVLRCGLYFFFFCLSFLFNASCYLISGAMFVVSMDHVPQTVYALNITAMLFGLFLRHICFCFPFWCLYLVFFVGWCWCWCCCWAGGVAVVFSQLFAYLRHCFGPKCNRIGFHWSRSRTGNSSYTGSSVHVLMFTCHCFYTHRFRPRLHIFNEISKREMKNETKKKTSNTKCIFFFSSSSKWLFPSNSTTFSMNSFTYICFFFFGFFFLFHSFCKEKINYSSAQ